MAVALEKGQFLKFVIDVGSLVILLFLDRFVLVRFLQNFRFGLELTFRVLVLLLHMVRALDLRPQLISLLHAVDKAQQLPHQHVPYFILYVLMNDSVFLEHMFFVFVAQSDAVVALAVVVVQQFATRH